MTLSALLSDEFAICCGTVTVDLARRKALLKDLGETLEEAATRGTFEQTVFRVDLLPVEIPTLATLPSGVAEPPETVTEPIAMTRSIASNGSLQVVF
ncbi:nudix domain-containing protein [Colletotrichum sojae]|uniref:Nudix domain-containing protein n=1 Tax=Colletotrichum sojae TaxID=2175907 RepID=A0A8H6ITZ9_9PEZI|nr:nudix domain-containing protein [Colletotrichum sojae]